MPLMWLSCHNDAHYLTVMLWSMFWLLPFKKSWYSHPITRPFYHYSKIIHNVILSYALHFYSGLLAHGVRNWLSRKQHSLSDPCYQVAFWPILQHHDCDSNSKCSLRIKVAYQLEAEEVVLTVVFILIVYQLPLGIIFRT